MNRLVDQVTPSATMSAVKRGLQPIAKTGHYVEQQGSQYSLTEHALLSADPSTDDAGTKVYIGAQRDISNSVGSSRAIVICDLGVQYPGGDMSTVFTLDDCVIEYRAAIGKTKTRTNGSNSFDSVYGKTYVSLGIPRARYDWIVKQVASQPKHLIKHDAVLLDDDYAWLVARLPPDDSSVRVLVTMDDGNGKTVTNELGPPIDVLASLKRNLLGIASVGMRLKKTATGPGKPLPAHFTLGATLSGLQLIDETDISAPPLQQAVAPTIYSTKVASERLQALLISSGGDDEEHEDEDDNGNKDEAEDGNADGLKNEE